MLILLLLIYIIFISKAGNDIVIGTLAKQNYFINIQRKPNRGQT